MTPLPLKAVFAVVATSVVAGVALLAQQAQPAGARMTEAANRFLASLTPEQRAKAVFPFDDVHREQWYFTPQQANRQPTRRGLRIEHINDGQKSAAMDLLRAGLSDRGFEQAKAIMALEELLAELEGERGAMVRNPHWYFVSIFGEPSNTGLWGWRFEGHHLSVNVTLDKGRVVTATPVLFGVNPAEVRQGPRKGFRVTPEIENLAKQLIASLSDEQKAAARQPKQFPEIKEGQPEAGVGDPVGIPAAKLTGDQKATLTKLIEAYANRLPEDVAAIELARVKEAGPDTVYFGYCIEEEKPGQPYTYRVQGPTFVVEFLNEQADSARNPANHIHSGWRRLPTDFPK